LLADETRAICGGVLRRGEPGPLWQPVCRWDLYSFEVSSISYSRDRSDTIRAAKDERANRLVDSG